jgi:aspartyl aminopeptidase
MNMEHTCADRFDPDEINRRLLSFLDRSPVSFYAVRNMAEELENAGAVRLFEGERWKLLRGRTYYVTMPGCSNGMASGITVTSIKGRRHTSTHHNWELDSFQLGDR